MVIVKPATPQKTLTSESPARRLAASGVMMRLLLGDGSLRETGSAGRGVRAEEQELEGEQVI